MPSGDLPPAQWRVHTPNLLKEILNNPTTHSMAVPLQIFGDILYAVGERASQINDPCLNALMARLTIYDCANPESPGYDPVLTEQLLAKGNQRTRAELLAE